MIRQSPCAYFIKALLVHPDRHSTKKVAQIIEEKALDPLNEEYIDGLRAKLRKPEPFYPTDPFHSPSRRFLIKERLESFYFQDEVMRQANAVLASPRGKEFIESMLLSGAPAPAIARVLMERFRLPCTDKTVQRYAHFYWNLELVDSTEVRALLQLRVDNLQFSPNQNHQAQFVAVRRASYKDPRKVAAGLPSSPLSALLSQMRAGVMPREVNLNEVLGRVRDAGALRALESIMNGSLEDAQAATLFMSASKTAMDMLDGLATPEAAVLDQLNKIQINSVETGVPSIQELSGGNFTTDVGTVPAGSSEHGG